MSNLFDGNQGKAGIPFESKVASKMLASEAKAQKNRM